MRHQRYAPLCCNHGGEGQGLNKMAMALAQTSAMTFVVHVTSFRIGAIIHGKKRRRTLRNVGDIICHIIHLDISVPGLCEALGSNNG